VIVSKHGKTYDTADGSEQQFDPRQSSSSRERAEVRADKGRWSDDGGASAQPPLVIVRELAWKPAWSVLSLKDLNEAIRRERADEPARRLREAEEAERRRVRAVIVEADRLAEEARNRYRNAWEHT
jgi:hypothetical protein